MVEGGEGRIRRREEGNEWWKKQEWHVMDTGRE